MHMRQTTAHHEVFQRFRAREGPRNPRWAVDFLGVRTRETFFPGARSNPLIATPWPPEVNEEYFEWISLLTAVVQAREHITIVELGAGWGRWLVRAALAMRQSQRLPLKLIGEEAEPSHFRYMKRFFRDNGRNPNDHWLIEAAVSDRPGAVFFYTGNPTQWYGQCVVSDPGKHAPQRGTFLTSLARLFTRAYKVKVGVREVKSINLDSILQRLTRADLLDADIQGSEAAVFESSAAQLEAKVRAVHIGTHSQEQESRLRHLFTSLGWEAVFDFPCAKQVETPWGTVRFEEGVQAWRNRHFLDLGYPRTMNTF
jgi:FkbM family methyltransferase